MKKYIENCVFYGDCPFNFSECEEDNPHHKCKERKTTIESFKGRKRLAVTLDEFKRKYY